jgi:hypothetical protein
MRFSMIKISSLREPDGNYRYESMIMEQGASTPWKQTFESEYHMVSIMNDILAKQRRAGDIRHLLSNIQRGEHYFFDVDLSKSQAELLGWNNSAEVGSLVLAN